MAAPVNSAEEQPLLGDDDESAVDKPQGGLDYLLQKSLGDAAQLAGIKKKEKKKKKKKPVSCWKLIFNCKFLFFFFNCFVCIGIGVWYWLVTPDNLMPYIASGTGVMISLYGYKTFNQLMQLMHETNEFSAKVAKMSAQKKAIKLEVNKISNANDELMDTEDRLRNANQKNRDNLKQFRSVQDTMKTLDIKSFQKIRKKAINAEEKWRNNLLDQERDMLHLIFDRFEMKNDKVGMDKNDFEQFSKLLPNQYEERFNRLGTFHKLSNHKGILEYADFEMVLDLFAEMVVDDVDIGFNLDIDKNDSKTVTKKPDTKPLAMLLSDSTSDSSSSDDDDDQGGFLTKLTTWRKTKKKEKMNHNVTRSITITARTPTGRSNNQLHDFGAINDNKLSPSSVGSMTDDQIASEDFDDADIDAYMNKMGGS